MADANSTFLITPESIAESEAHQRDFRLFTCVVAPLYFVLAGLFVHSIIKDEYPHYRCCRSAITKSGGGVTSNTPTESRTTAAAVVAVAAQAFVAPPQPPPTHQNGQVTPSSPPVIAPNNHINNTNIPPH